MTARATFLRRLGRAIFATDPQPIEDQATGADAKPIGWRWQHLALLLVILGALALLALIGLATATTTACHLPLP